MSVLYLGATCAHGLVPHRDDNNLNNVTQQDFQQQQAPFRTPGQQRTRNNMVGAVGSNGDNDNYDYQNSHVLAALMRKFYEANKKKSSNVEVWGTGECKREFLYSVDAANMILDILETDEKKILKFTKGRFSHINIGTGKDYSINDIAKFIKEISGFKGKIINNKNFPDGVKRKVLNVKLFNKICPNSSYSKNTTKKIFKENIKKVYLQLNEKKFKFKKNSTFNLPI